MVSVVNMLAFAVIMALLNWQLALLVYLHRPAAVRCQHDHGGQAARPLPARAGEGGRRQQRAAGEHLRRARLQGLRARGGAAPRGSTTRTGATCTANMATASVQAVATPAIQMISAWALAWSSGVATGRSVNGALTVGTLVAFLSYLIQFYQPVEDLMQVNNTSNRRSRRPSASSSSSTSSPTCSERPTRRARTDVAGRGALRGRHLRLRAGQAGAARHVAGGRAGPVGGAGRATPARARRLRQPHPPLLRSRRRPGDARRPRPARRDAGSLRDQSRW